MTVIVAFLCSDGVVIAADSMITASLGATGVGHHHGRKIAVLPSGQIFSFAGDQGLGARFRILLELTPHLLTSAGHPLEYGLSLSQNIITQFRQTGLDNFGLNSAVAFPHGGDFHCCMFEGLMQPRLLDRDHFYAALGSGKLSADPFLRFLVDTFCSNGPPTVREATLLAVWALQHVIDTNTGGVAEPIRVATMTATAAIELSPDEVAEHQQAVESGRNALRGWRDAFHRNPQGAAPLQPPPPAPEASPND